jgi:hypothetical protein
VDYGDAMGKEMSRRTDQAQLQGEGNDEMTRLHMGGMSTNRFAPSLCFRELPPGLHRGWGGATDHLPCSIDRTVDKSLCSWAIARPHISRRMRKK